MTNDPAADGGFPLESPAIFRPGTDGWLEPTGLASGPWYPGTQHGSAMLGALARAADAHPSPRPMHTTRLTCDLLRAAPMGPVRTSVRVVRAGRSIESLDIELVAEGKQGLETFARATALRTRVGELPVPADVGGEGDGPPLPEPTRFALVRPEPGQEAFHMALEMRPVAGLDPPACWFRLRVPFVEGEETSPGVRAAAIADFSYSVPIIQGAFQGNDFRRARAYSQINADTSLNLHRPMDGDWLCMRSRVYADAGGSGTALAVLSDHRGAIGHSSQSLLVRGIEARPAVWDDIEG